MSSTPQQMFNTIISSDGGKVKLEHLAKSVNNISYEDFLEVLYAKLNEIMIKMEQSRDKHFPMMKMPSLALLQQDLMKQVTVQLSKQSKMEQ